MKRTILSLALIIASGTFILFTNNRCSGTKESTGSEQTEIFRTNISGTGQTIELIFQKGKSFNHPLMVIWIEDLDGKYIETLFVSESIGKGIFQHANQSKGAWEEGPSRRPAALPYWGHKRGIRAADGLYIPDILYWKAKSLKVPLHLLKSWLRSTSRGIGMNTGPIINILKT
jgi:hypothetical protein